MSRSPRKKLSEPDNLSTYLWRNTSAARRTWSHTCINSNADISNNLVCLWHRLAPGALRTKYIHGTHKVRRQRRGASHCEADVVRVGLSRQQSWSQKMVPAMVNTRHPREPSSTSRHRCWTGRKCRYRSIGAAWFSSKTWPLCEARPPGITPRWTNLSTGSETGWPSWRFPAISLVIR